MSFDYYVWLVAVLAILYSIIIRAVQNRFVDKAGMQALQKQSSELNTEYKKAAERKDQVAMDSILKKQAELFPKMNKLLIEQLKMVFVILVVFFTFTWVANAFDPTVRDDIILKASDDGNGCDQIAGDGVFS